MNRLWQQRRALLTDFFLADFTPEMLWNWCHEQGMSEHDTSQMVHLFAATDSWIDCGCQCVASDGSFFVALANTDVHIEFDALRSPYACFYFEYARFGVYVQEFGPHTDPELTERIFRITLSVVGTENVRVVDITEHAAVETEGDVYLHSTLQTVLNMPSLTGFDDAPADIDGIIGEFKDVISVAVNLCLWFTTPAGEKELESVVPSPRSVLPKSAKEKHFRRLKPTVLRIGKADSSSHENKSSGDVRTHWVRGHWRKQWYGAKDARHQRLKWIQPHRRGTGETSTVERVYTIKLPPEG